MDNRSVILACVLVASILAGMVLAFTPGMYHHDLVFEEEQGEVDFRYDSNIGSSTTTVLMTDSGRYPMEDFTFLLDEGYASPVPIDLQRGMADDMRDLLSIRSLDSYRVCDSGQVLEMFGSPDHAGDVLIVASGALPDVLYDGTEDSPLIQWLRSGGVLVNVSGCLGKYVSHGPEETDIVQVEGYGELFAGVPDSSFNDSPVAVYGNHGCNETVRDALHFYMDETTYGICLDGIEGSLNLGYVGEDGYSAAAVFASGQGMVFNFSVSAPVHEHYDHFIAQVLASGLDYTSVILEVIEGDTRDDRSGSFAVPDDYNIYGYIGDTRAVFGERLSG